MSNPDPATSSAPYRIFNIGHNEPVELLKFVEVLEQTLGKTATKNLVPIQPGDVPETYADISRLEAAVGFRPRTSIEVGLAKFVEWYREYYKV
jgi:UDP-glucuronate 4-epimerase